MAYVVNDFARCYVYSGGFTFPAEGVALVEVRRRRSRRRRRRRRAPAPPPARLPAAAPPRHRSPPPPPPPPPLLLTASLHHYRRYIRDFYWPLAAAGLVLTVAILWWEGEVLHFGAWATFLTVVMYTANLWGVLMFIFLMSHALVSHRRRRRAHRRPPPRSPPPPAPLSRSSCRSNYGTSRELISGSNEPTIASASPRGSCCRLRSRGAPNSRSGNG